MTRQHQHHKLQLLLKITLFIYLHALLQHAVSKCLDPPSHISNLHIGFLQKHQECTTRQNATHPEYKLQFDHKDTRSQQEAQHPHPPLQRRVHAHLRSSTTTTKANGNLRQSANSARQPEAATALVQTPCVHHHQREPATRLPGAATTPIRAPKDHHLRRKSRRIPPKCRLKRICKPVSCCTQTQAANKGGVAVTATAKPPPIAIPTATVNSPCDHHPQHEPRRTCTEQRPKHNRSTSKKFVSRRNKCSRTKEEGTSLHAQNGWKMWHCHKKTQEEGKNKADSMKSQGEGSKTALTKPQLRQPLKTQPHHKQRSNPIPTPRQVAPATKINKVPHNPPLPLARHLSPQGAAGHDTAEDTRITKFPAHKGRQRKICPGIPQKCHDFLIMAHKTKALSDKIGVVNAQGIPRSQHKVARFYSKHNHFYTQQPSALPTFQQSRHQSTLPLFSYYLSAPSTSEGIRQRQDTYTDLQHQHPLAIYIGSLQFESTHRRSEGENSCACSSDLTEANRKQQTSKEGEKTERWERGELETNKK